MPLDAVCLKALIAELSPALVGARIDKVQQPEGDLLLLSLYTSEGNRRLLLSVASGGARLHFTQQRPENPDAPPMFCMLLRKHLVGARINAVTQPGYERIVFLDLFCRDEFGEESSKRIAVELMGRAANVILIDSDGRIIDCLRRLDFGEEAYRRLLPGMLYKLPQEQGRPCFYETDAAERRRLWAASDAAVPTEKRLMSVFSGLAPLISREIVYRAGCDENLPAAMDALWDTVAAREFSPVLVNAEGASPDFSFMRINQYGASAQSEVYSDFSSLLDAFYAGRDRAERMRRASSETMKNVRTLRDRQARKLAQQREELKASADRDALRRRGDLVTANLWRIKKGDRALVCEDYYADGSPECSIPLDPMKSPQQNAAAAYKDYKRAATAEKHLTSLIAEGEKQLDYLESVVDALSRAENERDVAEIRRELTETGVIRPRKNVKPQKIKPRGPMRFKSSSGVEILVGRSNVQNDELTLKTARRTDLWLHTKTVHGSHVIVRLNGEEPDETTITEAASLAAWFSQARGGGRTAVDYTQVRFVKKPSGALPGMVIYTDQTTVMAEPDEALANRLKAD
ncbi:MAG: NFACT family protein [Oscillospiraceae bacterium]